MTPQEYFKDRVFYVEEPCWSEWTRTAMNLFYKLEVEDPDQVVAFLQKRGFTFENEWQEKIVAYISEDLSNMEKQNWFFEENGFKVIPFSFDELSK